MSLSNLFGWNKKADAAPAAACGAGDKPAACGSACGSGDKPAACSSACGSGDKPAACGAGDRQ